MRQSAKIILITGLALAVSGCVRISLHNKKYPVTVQVRDKITGAPTAHIPLELAYHPTEHAYWIIRPKDISAETDEHGTVTLLIATEYRGAIGLFLKDTWFYLWKSDKKWHPNVGYARAPVIVEIIAK